MQMKPAQVWPLAIIPVTLIADQVTKSMVLANERFRAMETIALRVNPEQVARRSSKELKG